MFPKFLTVSILASAVLTANAQADTLLDAVNQTLATNPEVLIRTIEADARMDEIRQAKSGYLPSLDLTAGVGYENSRNSSTIGLAGDPDRDDQVRTRRDASLIARQMLFDGFAVSSEVDRQKARQASAAQDVCYAASNTALQVTQAYVNIMRQQSVVELMKANAEEHERLVKLIETQGRKGRSNDADVAQAQSRLVLAKANEISAESVLRDVKTQYQRLAGNLPEAYSVPAIPEQSPASLEAALTLGVEAHPVMKLATADVQAAEAQYEASKSAFMPRFEMEVGANWDTDANGGKDDTYNHVAKVNMTYNLYNGGGDKARRSQTSKLINEAIEIRNRARRQVEEEIRLAWVAIDYGSQRLLPLEEHVKQSDRSRELYNKQFLMGSRTLMDLLDSQNEYTSARQSAINARYDLLFNRFRLLNSTGTLLQSMDASLPVDNDCGVKVVAVR
ncbi:TolC family outer membrane protein [uncultured Endozoicomonas sp.]|uniref:TolC family outer membrane protein n=1 Tax=uncultured Endozoicomonas sp. TaxID=432652 RepID=UPI00262A61E7|nr:TolC family outer membrane protein [uncultured Endozoicomonas sp.]